jgi:glycosyltransferase involved in cell wall biosynthesis
VLKALNRLKDVDFEVLWIGAKNTELENMLRAETEPALWSKLRFRHNLAPREIAEELSRATLFVHAARADNSPNSVKEAVVAGVPVIATNTGGIPDYVIPEKNGFLFESGDVAGCGEQIERALAHPLFREGLVDTGTLEKMRQYLSAETMAAKFYESYLATLRVF